MAAIAESADQTVGGQAHAKLTAVKGLRHNILGHDGPGGHPDSTERAEDFRPCTADNFNTGWVARLYVASRGTAASRRAGRGSGRVSSGRRLRCIRGMGQLRLRCVGRHGLLLGRLRRGCRCGVAVRAASWGGEFIPCAGGLAPLARLRSCFGNGLRIGLRCCRRYQLGRRGSARRCSSGREDSIGCARCVPRRDFCACFSLGTGQLRAYGSQPAAGGFGIGVGGLRRRTWL